MARRERYVTGKEAAKLLRVSRARFYQMKIRPDHETYGMPLWSLSTLIGVAKGQVKSPARRGFNRGRWEKTLAELKAL